MHSHHLGIDVAKSKLDCALRRPDGKFMHKSVANNREGLESLMRWMVKQGGHSVHVCMEATGVYWEAAAEYLSAQPGTTVSVINPFQIKAFGQSAMTRTKTDRCDAKLIAQFCHERRPDVWIAPSASEQTLRALILRLDALQNMRTQESNRLDTARPTLQPSIALHMEWLDGEIKRITQLIRDHIDSDPDLGKKRDLLDTIPGLGERTIAMLLAFFARPERFLDARQAVAFAGLDPRHHESGSSVKGKPALSKVGHAIVRKMLYMPAMVTLYRTDWGRRIKDRLTQSGKAPMVMLGAMMRKLLVVAFGVLKSGKPFDPALHGA